MRNKVILLLCVVVVVSGAFLAFALSQAGSLVRSYKSEIESFASAKLGIPVRLGDIEVALFPQVKLRVNDVSLEANQASALRVKGLSIAFRLWPLLKKRVEVSQIELIQPYIQLVKDASGLGIPGLAGSRSRLRERAERTSPAGPKGQSDEKTTGQVINLQSLSISDGSVEVGGLNFGFPVTFGDIDLGTAIQIAPNQIAVNNLRLSCVGPVGMPLALKAPSLAWRGQELSLADLTVGAYDNSMHVSGTYDLAVMQANLDVKSDSVTLSKFESFYPPSIQALRLQGAIAPNLKLALAGPKNIEADGTILLKQLGLTHGNLNLSNMTGTILLTKQQDQQLIEGSDIEFMVNAAPLGLALTTQYNQQSIRVKSFKLKGFGGAVGGESQIDLGTDKVLSARLDGEDLDLRSLFAALSPPSAEKFDGHLDKLMLSIRGNVANVPQSLSGTLQLNLKDGTIRGTNIAQVVLKALNNLPFIAGTSLGNGPENKRPEFNSSDTAFESLSADFKILGAALTTKNLRLVAPAYNIEAQGRIGFDSTLDLKASILFEPSFSASLVGSVKQLKAALDPQGRLVVPLVIQGKPPKLVVLPDIEQLLKGSLGRTIEEKASRVLEDVLSGKKPSKSGKGLGGLLGF